MVLTQYTKAQTNDSIIFDANDFKNNGIKIKISSIDPYGKLKVAKYGNVGSLLYSTNEDSFDATIADAISNENSEHNYKNIILLKYNSNLEELTISEIKYPTPLIAIVGQVVDLKVNKAEILKKPSVLVTGSDADIFQKLGIIYKGIGR